MPAQKRLVKLSILLLSTAYLAVALSHIYFLPQYKFITHHHYNSIFKRKTDNNPALQRFGKVVLNTNESVDLTAKALDDHFAYLKRNIPGIYTGIYRPPCIYLPDRHYTYLSNRTFRI
ncbi:MAG TPA: hypothetical protein VHC47_07805 [Mucilaginibacter sp.]|nr:hypothetical protein [Mucilaginibacter sp.]